MLSGEAQPEAA